MTLFIKPLTAIDCDGVLADFDRKAFEIFGMPARQWEDVHGSSAFWKTLQRYEDDDGLGFFESLPVMPGAKKLYESLKHLSPVILTGCPMGDWAPEQKLRWRDRHFPGVPMITCMAREKIKHLENPGDVLIDDMTKYQHIWEEGGGEFVHHTDVDKTLAEVRDRFPIFFQHTDWWTPPA